MCPNKLPEAAETQRPLTLLQERFLKSGLEHLQDQEIVELLLSLVSPCPRFDAESLPLACRECKKQREEIIKKLKALSLRELLLASPQQLKRIGVSPFGVFCIKLLHELPKEVLKHKIIDQPVYKSSQEIFDYLYYSMQDLKKEVFKVIYINNRNQIVEAVDLFEGTLESISIHPRKIVESAIERNATALIFAHNHPTGDPTPSKSDKQLTRDLVFIGMILQIKVLDHIIIGSNTYFSFADQELIHKYEDNFLNLKIRRMFENRVDYLKKSRRYSYCRCLETHLIDKIGVESLSG